jgi:hypothetical protein
MERNYPSIIADQIEASGSRIKNQYFRVYSREKSKTLDFMNVVSAYVCRRLSLDIQELHLVYESLVALLAS